MKGRVSRDKRGVRCFKCGILGHFVAECRRPKKSFKEQRQEANLTKIDDEEPSLLLAKHDKKEGDLMLINEG